MSLDEEPKTEPGFIITVSLTTDQRLALDEIKDARMTASGNRPAVRELMLEAVQQFIDKERPKKAK